VITPGNKITIKAAGLRRHPIEDSVVLDDHTEQSNTKQIPMFVPRQALKDKTNNYRAGGGGSSALGFQHSPSNLLFSMDSEDEREEEEGSKGSEDSPIKQDNYILRCSKAPFRQKPGSPRVLVKSRESADIETSCPGSIMRCFDVKNNHLE